ncbi:cobalt ECF transporter T component CbiQ [Planosporangium mesophilum]|nr:cobalt ECF transporter T component CbiQ [Planosporangium mesophilum]
MGGTVQASRTPDWLLRGEPGLCRCGPAGIRRKGSFVEKTLTGGADLLRQVMFSEEIAGRPGLLQRLDPRLKAVSLVVLLVAVGLVHHVGTLVACYALTLLLATASRLPLAFFIKRVWLFIPIFSGIVVLPATLSIVTPGEVVLPLWHWHGAPQGFTAQGLTSAALVISRVATSVSLVVLLTLTTPWTRLLAALRALGVPRIFILIIGMAYRYVFLLLGVVTEMYEARKARTVRARRNDRAARGFVAASAGALFGRAGHLSEEVHLAMVARGYRGSPRTLHAFRLRAADAVAAVVVLAAAVTIYGGDVLVGR